MTTFMIAWHCTMRTPTITSTDTHMSVTRIVSSVAQCHIICARTVAQVMSLSLHPHGHVYVSVSLHLDSLSISCTSSRTLSFFFLQHLKLVDNLCTPPNESTDSTDEFYLSTGDCWKQQRRGVEHQWERTRLGCHNVHI